MEAFRPRKQKQFFMRHSFQRKYLGETGNVLSEKIVKSFHFNHIFAKFGFFLTAKANFLQLSGPA